MLSCLAVLNDTWDYFRQYIKPLLDRHKSNCSCMYRHKHTLTLNTEAWRLQGFFYLPHAFEAVLTPVSPLLKDYTGRDGFIQAWEE